MSDCLFCKIIKKEIPSKVIAENNHVLVIQDIAPKAPVHYLIIPKKHIVDICKLEDMDASLAWEMIKMARELSKELPGSQAFNLISNNGKDAGQCVFHLHWHFLAGKNIYKEKLSL